MASELNDRDLEAVSAGLGKDRGKGQSGLSFPVSIVVSNNLK